MRDRPGLEFNFSGLKTAVMLAVREARADAVKADVARGVEDAIVETLCAKALRRSFTGHEALVVAGGVAPTRCARGFTAAARGARVYYPRPEFCTDNAAMIALAGLVRLSAGECSPRTVRVRARWSIAEACATGEGRIMSSPPAEDRLFLRGLEVECIIGFIDWERRIRQKGHHRPGDPGGLRACGDARLDRRLRPITRASPSVCWHSSVNRNFTWLKRWPSGSRRCCCRNSPWPGCA
jgi:hypothetical protein